ncbi:uncharacterized protein LOC114362427 [Ostrinia furnacalis]|uniref:uncharacterized protein LOC114362427 n=1 Tax=Ostrinia furnacalis TaxID=93504 RepID=UPI001038CFE1|nr:uncharacterized protein LOC114362427 [Ostrinia furnacalis]
MACIVLGYLYSFYLFINICRGIHGVDVLNVDDTTLSTTQSTDNRLNEQKIFDNVVVHRNNTPKLWSFLRSETLYKCHNCKSVDCAADTLSVCDDGLYCYKATVLTLDGVSQQSRGCSTSSEHEFTCHSFGPRKRFAGQRNITCCKGDMCNYGSFPTLPMDKKLSNSSTTTNSTPIQLNPDNLTQSTQPHDNLTPTTTRPSQLESMTTQPYDNSTSTTTRPLEQLDHPEISTSPILNSTLEQQ